MKTARDTKRQERHRHEVPSVAIAGYTNAGKSSLLNRLTGAGVLVENALFATLDPTVRRAQTAGRARLHADRHRRLRPPPAAPAGRGLPLDAGGGRRGRPDPARRRRLGRRPGVASSPPCARCSPTSTRQHVPELVVINKADAADPLVARPAAPPRAALPRRLGAHRRGARRAARPLIGPRAAAARRSRSTSCCPTTAATSSPGCTTRARCSSRSTSPTAPGSRAGVAPALAAELVAYAGARRRPAENRQRPNRDRTDERRRGWDRSWDSSRAVP